MSTKSKRKRKGRGKTSVQRKAIQLQHEAVSTTPDKRHGKISAPDREIKTDSPSIGIHRPHYLAHKFKNKSILEIQQGEPEYNLMYFHSNEEGYIRIARFLYNFILRYSKYHKLEFVEPDWPETTPAWQVLLWTMKYIDKMFPKNIKWHMVYDSDNQYFDVVQYSQSDTPYVTGFYVSFLPIMKKVNPKLYYLVLEFLQYLSWKCGMNKWDDGYFEHIMEWMGENIEMAEQDQADPEEVSYMKSVFDLYTTGEAAYYSSELMQRPVKSLNCFKNKLNKYHPKKESTGYQFKQWMLEGIKLMEAGLNIHDFAYFPDDPSREELYPVGIERYILLFWEPDAWADNIDELNNQDWNEYGAVAPCRFKVMNKKNLDNLEPSNWIDLLVKYLHKSHNITFKFKKKHAQHRAKPTEVRVSA